MICFVFCIPIFETTFFFQINSLLAPNEIEVLNGLGTVCSEVVSDSADALADLTDSLLPWLQTGSYYEKKAALLTLRSTLRYANELTIISNERDEMFSLNRNIFVTGLTTTHLSIHTQEAS